MAATAAGGAGILRREREIVNTFRGAGATSADRARDPSELGVEHHIAFKRLVGRAVLRDAGGGKYYLDELSWNAIQRLRHRIVIVMLVVVIGAAVVLFVSGVFASRI